ncbi:MAG: Uma2 family endonuclease [Chloroflexota bacterium]|nr:Uma2 family endonuclease [Chloroflexota bacterium]MDE2962041.1 Uma2 family endonuclease [Chloroflexota bacterium]
MTADTFTRIDRAPGRFRLPDPPQREPDEMTQYDQLFKRGKSRDLAIHLGNSGTTLVEADRWIVPDASFDKRRARYPDLLVAFDVSPADYEASNGYIVSEQGKPPDFVLEVASESTAEVDLNEKRDYYAMVGVLEYWRFDKTGEHYGARLYGERLVDGVYQPIPVDELPGGDLQGHSAALEVNLRCEGEELAFYDPATGGPIMTYEAQQARADAAEAQRDAERQARNAAEARAATAEAQRDAEQARVRELEELLLRQQSGP